MAVPSGFYSIVSRCGEARSDPCPVSSLEVLGLVLHHRKLVTVKHVCKKMCVIILLLNAHFFQNISDYFSFHLSTVADIESATGINSFPDLSPEQQAALKLHIITALWN